MSAGLIDGDTGMLESVGSAALIGRSCIGSSSPHVGRVGVAEPERSERLTPTGGEGHESPRSGAAPVRTEPGPGKRRWLEMKQGLFGRKLLLQQLPVTHRLNKKTLLDKDTNSKPTTFLSLVRV